MAAAVAAARHRDFGSAAARQRDVAAVRRRGKLVVGEKGIKPLGYCEVIKPAIIFCDCKKAIKCILRVHYNDKNMGGFLTTGTVISEVIEHLGDFIL